MKKQNVKISRSRLSYGFYLPYMIIFFMDIFNISGKHKESSHRA